VIDKFSAVFKQVHDTNFSEKSVISKKEILRFSNKLSINSPKEKARKNGNHSVIFGTRNNYPVVLKTNSNPVFALRTLTEIYTLINLNGTLDKLFSTPELIDFGFTDDKYLWLITNRLPGEYLKGNTKSDVEILCKATISILRSGLKVPFKDEKRLKSINGGKSAELLNKLEEIAIEWKKEFSEDIGDLMKIMGSYPINQLPPATVHGDLVARHIINLDNNKYHIYDWELTGGAWFWGYEPAYVYHRTFTRDGDKNLAKEYLCSLFRLMNSEERHYLKTSFKPMLAQRIIGGYKDYSDTTTKEYINNKILHKGISGIAYLPYDLV
jgi:hypothetical protein